MAGSPVRFFDWGFERSAGLGQADITNAISLLDKFDSATQTMIYRTGGESGVDSDALLEAARGRQAPDRIVTEQREGAILVRIRMEPDVNDSVDVTALEAVAARTARVMHQATTNVWPATEVSVLLDLYIMPTDAVFSLARQVTWTPPEPLQLVMFSHPDGIGAESPTHELYHVLAAWRGFGWKSAEGTDRLNASVAYEEIVAELYGHCGLLLADGALRRPEPDYVGVINGRRLVNPLKPEDIAFVRDVLHAADDRPQDDSRPLGTLFGKILEHVPTHSVFGTRDRITLDSTAGRELVALCRQLAADPMRLGTWLSAAIGADADQLTGGE